MNRKGSSWHALRARNAHLLLSGFDLLHHAEFSLVRRPQIKLIYFCIEDGNSPLFNDQLLIKRADNAPRKVTKYPADWTHSFIVGMISITARKIFIRSHYIILSFCSVLSLPSTERWPITDRYIGEVSTNYRRGVGEMSAKCRWSIGERKAISAETHLERLSTVSRPSVVRLSSESRPTIDRYIDRVSIDYRTTIDRVSTDYRPLYRPIDRILVTAPKWKW